MSYVNIDEHGVSASTFDEILMDIKNKYRQIYGDDVYLENDSQDGQFLALIARAIGDTAAIAVGLYNSFSPVSALSDALSKNVAINGIARATASNSTTPVVLVGAIGTIIRNGMVSDDVHRWRLPDIVTIDNAGTVTVNAICEDLGAISATPHSINKILTPTRGWYSVDNPNAAVLGSPIENDAALRQRQTLSVAIPSLGLLDGTLGALAALEGVTHYQSYENETSSVNHLGMPPHSMAFVIAGGSEQAIAEVIKHKKTMGCTTVGNISRTVLDKKGGPSTVRFYRPAIVSVKVQVSIKAMNNYNDAIGAKIKQSIADYINTVMIGGEITSKRLDLAAALNGSADSFSYEVIDIKVNGQGSLDLPFTALGVCTVNDVVIGVS